MVVALFAAILLAACGSSKSSSASTSSSAAAPTSFSSSTPTAKATGPAVDVWNIVPVGAPNQSAPQIPAGVNAEFRYVNSHGGIGPDHQPVDVKVCNTQGSPNGEVQCAMQAAHDPKAIATLGDLIVVATAPAEAAFGKAGLASINPFLQSPADFVNKINFPLFAPNFTSAGCAVLAPRAAHVKKIAFASLTLPISLDEMKIAEAAAKKAGFTVTGQVSIPLTTTNVSPYVHQLAAGHPQMTVLLLDPELSGAYQAAAAQIGASGPVCAQDGLVVYQALAGLGQAAANTYVTAFLPDPAWKGYPLLSTFRSDAAAELASGDKSASLEPGNDPLLTLEGWVAAYTVPQVASHITGTITRAKFYKAINQATVTFGSGKGAILPPIDFAKPNSIKQYSRLFNTSLFLKKWEVATKSFVRATPTTENGDTLIP